MNRKINIIGLTLFFTLTLFSFVFSEESMTITTYYPSPYGSYNELQLYPHSLPVTSCGSSTRGTMYYDSDDNQTKICDGNNWQTIGPPSGAVMFFNLSSCPSGWTEYTALRGRYVVGLPSGGTLAEGAGIALSNQEDRHTGAHSHGITQTPHGHSIRSSQGDPVGYGVDFEAKMAVVDGYDDYAHRSSGDNANITINNEGSVDHTNAPYRQFLCCQKD